MHQIDKETNLSLALQQISENKMSVTYKKFKYQIVTSLATICERKTYNTVNI